MKNSLFIIPITIFFFVGCKGQKSLSQQSLAFVDTAMPFKKEIPTNRDGSLDGFYSLAKDKQRQLGLASLDGGFDNLQIRVWYDFSLVRERKLVVITNKGKNWTATVWIRLGRSRRKDLARRLLPLSVAMNRAIATGDDLASVTFGTCQVFQKTKKFQECLIVTRHI